MNPPKEHKTVMSGEELKHLVGEMGFSTVADLFNRLTAQVELLNSLLAQRDKEAKEVFADVVPIEQERNALKRRVSSMEETLEYVRGLGEVYVYPENWRCAKRGGPPEMSDYERVDLSGVGLPEEVP